MTEPCRSDMRFRLRRDAGGVVSRIWRRRWARLLAVLAVLLLAAWAAMWLIFARGLPSADALLTYTAAASTNVRAVDGTPVHSYARERRVELSFDEYPKLLIDAYISAEDKTFFRHSGIDYPGLAARWSTTSRSWDRGARARGGSTITQQVAKNLLVGDEYSVSRKIREAILARRIEHALTKQQILELYLNQIFLGRNAYGVQSAARAYFDRDVDQLTLPQMAYLRFCPRRRPTTAPSATATGRWSGATTCSTRCSSTAYITPAQRAEAGASPLGTVARVLPPRDDVGGFFMRRSAAS